MEENNCGTHSKITPLREFQVQIFIHYTAIFVMNERGVSKITNYTLGVLSPYIAPGIPFLIQMKMQKET